MGGVRQRPAASASASPFARRGVPVALALAVLTALVAGGGHWRPAVAEAHAALVSADPANNETLDRPPARIKLTFSEPVERQLTEITVVDKDKQRVDNGDIAFDDNNPAFVSVGVKTLPPGLYIVRWSNVSSVDGHNLSGQYPFIVLNPDHTFPAGVSFEGTSSESGGGALLPNNIDVVLKWLALLALATAAGAAFFLFAVLRPAARFLEDDDYHAAVDAGERWVVNLAHVLLPLAFIASAFLMLLAVNRFATDTSVWDYLTTVRTGRYRGIQLGLIALSLVGADLLFLGGSARKRNAGLALMLLAGAAALYMNSAVSHAGTGAGRFWATVSDYLHLLASAAWLGALVMLVPLFVWLRRRFEQGERFLYLANVFDRFSLVAGVSVLVILATGAFNGLTEIPNPSAMVDTTYGKVLVAKLALMMPLLAVAGLNAFILKPYLVRTIDTLYQGGGTTDARLRADGERRLATLQRLLPRTVVLEITLVAAVFAAVAVLTQTATAKGEIAQAKGQQQQTSKFTQTTTQSGVKLTITVDPNRAGGLNTYGVLVQTPDGAPIATVTQVRLRFNYDDIPGAVAPQELILNRFAPGEYRAVGAYFTQPGNWRTDLSVRRSDADDINTTFVLPVAPAVRQSAGQGSAYALPFNVFSWNEVLGVALVLAGGAIIVYRGQLRWLSRAGYRAGIGAATALLLAGAVFVFGVHSHTTSLDLTKGNPVKPTQDSVERGRLLFQQNCIQCHGIDGRGDGPEAASLSPAPTDFRLHTPLHTDPQFYAFIANGYPGSQMPAFKDAFSEEDIWNLVNYLRAAFSDAPSQ